MPPTLTKGKLTLNKRGNPWNFFVLIGTDFPAHNKCKLKIWKRPDPKDEAHRWKDADARPSSTATRLVCRVKVPPGIVAKSGTWGSETLDITVTNTDTSEDSNEIPVEIEIVDEP